MERIKVVYIIGTDRSGSTLLDMILGSNHGFVSTGEIHYFNDYLNNLSHCSCGLPSTTCIFWSQVVKSLQKNSWIAKYVNPLGWKKRLSINIQRAFTSAAIKEARFNDFAGAHRALYKEILNISGCNYLVDSSKDATRAYLLHLSGYFNIYPIYITRKVEDYLVSIKRPQASSKNGRIVNPKIATWKWVFRNTESRYLTRKIRKDHVHISYEKLASTPSTVIDAIGELYELPVKYDVNQINNENYHIIGGNLMKFKRFEGIFYDKKEESNKYQSVLHSLLNKMFVFSNV